MLEKKSVSITEDEAALYDRQIRLWGLDAQKRYWLTIVLQLTMFTVREKAPEFGWAYNHAPMTA